MTLEYLHRTFCDPAITKAKLLRYLVPVNYYK